MVTELEIVGASFGPGERYVLRYHRSHDAEHHVLAVGMQDASVSWNGFRYRDNEVSILLLRQGRPSTAA